MKLTHVLIIAVIALAAVLFISGGAVAITDNIEKSSSEIKNRILATEETLDGMTINVNAVMPAAELDTSKPKKVYLEDKQKTQDTYFIDIDESGKKRAPAKEGGYYQKFNTVFSIPFLTPTTCLLELLGFPNI